MYQRELFQLNPIQLQSILSNPTEFTFNSIEFSSPSNPIIEATTVFLFVFIQSKPIEINIRSIHQSNRQSNYSSIQKKLVQPNLFESNCFFIQHFISIQLNGIVSFILSLKTIDSNDVRHYCRRAV